MLACVNQVSYIFKMGYLSSLFPTLKLPPTVACSVAEIRNSSERDTFTSIQSIKNSELNNNSEVGKCSYGGTQSATRFIHMQQAADAATAHQRAQVQQQKNNPVQSKVWSRAANK